MTHQPNFPQDPGELFDVVNEDGSPTGIVKRRADVHRDGDWHRAIHVWVHGVDEDGSFILYNRRGLLKDTWPGKLDVTVGGHLAAGEQVNQAFREIEEEIGIAAAPEGLRFLYTRKAYGVVERELQDVFLYRDNRPLAAYQPNPAELEGLVRIAVADALALFDARCLEVAGDELLAPSGQVVPVRVTAADLLPVTTHDYYLDIARRVAVLADSAPAPGASASP